jgi:hypothetical protein
MTLKKIAVYLLIPAVILMGIGIIIMVKGPKEAAGFFGAPGLFILLVAIGLYLVDLFLDYIAKKFHK